jgi:O-antigen ligase
MFKNLRQHLPWVLGFLLCANLYLVPTAASSPRATDAMAAGLAIWAVRRLSAGRLPLGTLSLLAIANVLPVAWLFFSLLDPDLPTVAQCLRWLFALPWALALVCLVATEDERRRFAWGLIVGGGVNVAVVVLQSVGIEAPLRLVGLSSSDAVYHHYVYNQVRIPGMHGHHAASSAIMSLMIPASLYLYFRKHGGLVVPLGCLAGLLIALNLTSTRSPLIISALTLGYAFVVARQFGRGFLFGVILIVVTVPAILVFGPPGGRNRWEDALALQANAGERFESNYASAEIALQHPLGLGVKAGQSALYDLSGIDATHNAYLQAAVFLGLPLAVLILVTVVVVALRGLHGPQHPDMLLALLAFHTAGLFLFEEHLNNPTFVILASWFIAATVRRQPRPWRHQVAATGTATAP